MNNFPLAITGVGMVTGVGLNAPASCAAIRCAIDNVQETRFMDSSGERLMGCAVPLEYLWRNKDKLLKMATLSISECLKGNKQINPEHTPLLLCLSERVHHVLIAATDSLLVGPMLEHYEEYDRLKTSTNSNGFIPGEAGAALVVELGKAKQDNQLFCCGLGFGVERAHVSSDEPLRANGLVAAMKASLEEAGHGESILDFKITDLSGEQYYFKEASLAFSRIDRTKREEFDLWHPAECIGEVGTAIGLIMIGVVKAACEKGYSKGRVILAHLGNDDGERASMILACR